MLHLTTAANGAESFYESGPDTPRMEGAQAGPCPLVSTPRMEGAQANPNPNPSPHPNPSPNQAARDLDERIRTAWLGHPNHTVLYNGEGGFEGKLRPNPNPNPNPSPTLTLTKASCAL